MRRSNVALAEVEQSEIVAEVALHMADRGVDVPFFVAARAAARVSDEIQRLAAQFPDADFAITITKK